MAEAVLDVAFFSCWVENRYWHYRSTNYPFSHIESIKNAVSTRNPADPYFSEEIPDLHDDHAHFQFEYGRSYTSNSENLIEVFGYDKSEAAKLKQRYEQEGTQTLLAYQRDALQAVLRCRPLWQFKHNLLEIYGLPATQKEAVRLLSQ